MTITVELSIDLRNQGFPQRIRATQADANTRVVEVSLYDGGVAWPVPDGVAAAVGYRKPDGTAGLYDKLPDGTDALTISENTVTAILAPQVLTAPGIVSAVIILTDANMRQLSTFPFHIYVEKNPAAGLVVSDNYINVVDAIGDLNTLVTEDKTSLVAAINEIARSNGGTISDEQIAQAVADYLTENPIEGGYTTTTEITDESTDEEVPTAAAVREYVGQHSGGNVTAENIGNALGYTPADAEVVRQLASETANLLPKNQGAENAGKMMGVDSNGAIIPMDFSIDSGEASEVAIPVTNTWERFEVMGSTNVNATPKPVTSTNYTDYTSYAYVVPEATSLYFTDYESADYLSLAYYPSGNIHANDESVGDPAAKRLRLSDGNLPTQDSQLAIESGWAIVITVKTHAFKLYGLATETQSETHPLTELIDARIDAKINALHGETEVPVTVGRDWEGWTIHASTNISSSGTFITSDSYSGNTTYSYTAQKDCDIYVERFPVGNDSASTYICLGIYPSGDPSDTTNFIRYRYVLNSEDTLPKVDTPLSITAGTLVAVCVYTSNFNVYGLVTEMQNKSLADLIDDRIDAKLGIAVQLINNGANQTVTVYHASNGDYCIGQTFERVPNTEKNSDVWHLKHAYICDTNSFSKVNSNPTADNYFDGQIVNNGEWENAIKETGMDDFMGGTLHGDEKFTSVIFFLDGKPLDMSADFFLYGRELKVIETTGLYRVADRTTKVIDRSCIWTFKDGEIKVVQTHKFAVDSTLLSSYTMMFPVNKKYSENFLVDGNPVILNFPKETANKYEPEDTINITEQLATVWGNGVVCDVSIKSSVNGTWFMQDNGNVYNKLYFDIGNRNYSVGDVIKTKTTYRMRIGEYTA